MLPYVERNVRLLEPARLHRTRQPDAGAQEQLDDEPVPAGELRGSPPELLEQPPLLGLGQEAWRRGRQPPQGHRPRGVLRHLSGLFRPGEEGPDSHLEAVQLRRGTGGARGRGHDGRGG